MKNTRVMPYGRKVIRWISLPPKSTQNKEEIQMLYVEDDHDAIISKRIWECVQLEIKCRKKYLEEHFNLDSFSISFIEV